MLFGVPLDLEVRAMGTVCRIALTRWSVFFGSLLVSCLVALPCLATPPSDSENFREHVAAGEFGLAARAATKLPIAERDVALAEIAARQAASGARRGSLSTLLAIEGQSARTGAVESIRRQPLVPRVGGGGVMADFDTLIDLIETTIAPDSWIDAGGTGSVSGFPTGVLVDDSGVMSRVSTEITNGLPELRRASLAAAANRDPRVPAKLRKVSLPRLERALELRYAEGKPPTDAMLQLAGLQRVQYVFVYEETGDIVIAGPAGDWGANEEGRIVSAETGVPVLHLDDLVAVLRNSAESGTFGCSITPTRENLEAAQEYLAETGSRPLAPGKASREKWVAGLREKLGLQEITVHGVEPGSHAAKTIVEADYHMKRIGMGLEKGVLGVTSYLDAIELKRGESPPPLGVLRWWFTLGDGAIRAAEDRNAFELKGPSVKVLSENELLTKRGERVHTGKSEELNAQFADSFTRCFDALAAKYPIYAELRNLFDLAVVAAVIKHERLADRTLWQAAHLLDPEKYVVRTETAPTQVMSIANYRVINDRTLVAGVSGGVEVVASSKLNTDRYQSDRYGDLEAGRAQSAKPNLGPTQWWWD
jgi:hypothetical protein